MKSKYNSSAMYFEKEMIQPEQYMVFTLPVLLSRKQEKTPTLQHVTCLTLGTKVQGQLL